MNYVLVSFLHKSHYYALQLGLAEVGYTGCEEEAQAEPDYGTQLMQLRDLQSLADQRVVHLERVSEQRLVNLERLVAELGEKKPLMWPYCICCIVVAMAVALLYLV
ncbi:unnamed protein product [Brassica oleracea var. botrytis]|uniref:(rape) hypothetical protein n=1 Tax=Brassica napus TaxID=3708 RepID=A0A816I3J6_BRANA|nr:unnamed protein product [Brassica napus]